MRKLINAAKVAALAVAITAAVSPAAQAHGQVRMEVIYYTFSQESGRTVYYCDGHVQEFGVTWIYDYEETYLYGCH